MICILLMKKQTRGRVKTVHIIYDEGRKKNEFADLLLIAITYFRPILYSGYCPHFVGAQNESQ